MTRLFRPQRLLRGPHLQTLLASVGPRRADVAERSRGVLNASRDLVLECGDGVRLLAHHSAHGDGERDLVVLLHGWEGSAQSQYLLSAAASLFDQGYDVVRLNLRDHGPTHHLNRELFHSCRIDEVVGATSEIAQRIAHRRLLFVGYSLGGNFALRVALRAPGRGIRLDAVAAICPVLDPAQTMGHLESGSFIYRRYFIFKWARSLRMKAAAWPGVFDFSKILATPSLASMTRDLVETFTDFPAVEVYLRGYALVGEILAPLEVPSLIIAADDDPIISAEGLSRLARPKSLFIDAQPFGGHCGFLEGLRGPSWADRRVVEWFARQP
jgi:hypothetical protein